jgi:hypothetical protein
MGLLTLYIGLLLPWLGGTLWLVFAESHLNCNTPPNRFRQAGYGFFVGFAVLFLAIITANELTGTVSWLGIMLFLFVFSASGGVAVWRNRVTASSFHPVPQTPLSTNMKILTVLMLALMAIHFIFMTVEVFTQPLYPWDAWLVWAYRAKAWFLAGGMVDFVSSAEWLVTTSADTYSIDAWRYPLFASVMPYWAALSLGHWSETLINLPVLFAGLAIGLALYGQLREYGLNVTISIIACYMLYSIPIFGTHIALAGYADIWMSGFVGLGLISVMTGAIKHAETGKLSFPVILGYLMIGFGILVKNEGLVWFLAALLMLVVATCKPRIQILTVVITVALVSIGFALGFTHIDIPLIGTLGFVNGEFIIPFFGGFVLESHSVWRAYWENFFTMGNWNLLWILVAVGLFSGLKPVNKSSAVASRYRIRRFGLSFILIFLATQLFIFGLTEQGRWAETFTAINRLPLHFIPALLFIAFVMVHSSLNKSDSEISTVESRNGSV